MEIESGWSFLCFSKNADRGGLKEEKELGTGKGKIQFDMKPEELEAFLNDYIFVRRGETDPGDKDLYTLQSNQVHRAHQGPDRYEGVGQIKNNILMIGPTGVGKTYLIKLIAKKIGVPLLRGTRRSSARRVMWVGMWRISSGSVYEANGDMDLAQYGIIYVDEIDKIASSNNLIGPDVSRTGVQRACSNRWRRRRLTSRFHTTPFSTGGD